MNAFSSIPVYYVFIIVGIIGYYYLFFSYDKYLKNKKHIKNISIKDNKVKNFNIFDTEIESVQNINEKNLEFELPKEKTWASILSEIQEQSHMVQTNNTLDQYLEDNNIEPPK